MSKVKVEFTIDQLYAIESALFRDKQAYDLRIKKLISDDVNHPAIKMYQMTSDLVSSALEVVNSELPGTPVNP